MNKNKTNIPHEISREIKKLLIEKSRTDDGKRRREINKKVKALKKRLDRISGGVSISDHAMLRYMERFMGIDVELIRSSMMTLVKNVYMGDGKYKLGEDVYAIIKGGNVVTFIDEDVQYKSK